MIEAIHNDADSDFRLSYSVDDDLLAEAIKRPVACTAVTGRLSVFFDHRFVGSRRELVATAVESEEPNPILADAFGELGKGRLPSGSNLKEVASSLDENGMLKPNHVPPLSALPKDFQELCDHAYNKLYVGLQRTVDLVRWRGGLSGGKQHQLLSQMAFEFSFDNQATWNPVPHRLSLKVHWGFPMPTEGLEQTVFDDVSKFAPTVSEPVSRQLFRKHGKCGNRIRQARSSLATRPWKLAVRSSFRPKSRCRAGLCLMLPHLP